MTNPYDQPQPYGQPQTGDQPVAYGYPAPYGQSPYGQPPYGQSPYGQPPYGPQSPYGVSPYGPSPGHPAAGAHISDHLVWSILNIFLFWPLAIFAIIKSNEVKSYKMQGNFMMAEKSSRTAKTCNIVATCIGALWILLWIIWFVFIFVAVGSYSSHSF